MGKTNIITKRYMQDNSRFADICNFFLYDGQQVIKPEEIEDFDKFKTELGPLLEFISCAGSDETLEAALNKKGKQWEAMSKEAIDLLNICLDAKLEVSNNLEKGAGNVCKGIEELAAKREARGEARGEERLGRLVSILCNNQQFEEIQKVASDAELRKKYYLQYNI